MEPLTLTPQPQNLQPSTYRLFYLKGRGPAELIRWLLIHSGQAFQDCRLTLAQWREIRGQVQTEDRIVLPLLEVEGREVLSGAVPIALFLAGKCGLAGQNKDDEALVTQVVEAVSSVQGNLSHVVRAVLGRQEEKRKLEWAVFTHRYLTPFLDEAEALLPNVRSWVVGNKLTVADLAVAELLNRMEECFDSNTLRDYEKLRRLVDRVVALPAISDWTADRPHTLF